ncbi:MAG: hypothetical protein KGI71_05230 [Patescibacteria group bacterium]|nr:hypothetical protein [Patescibacteria group bacterium]
MAAIPPQATQFIDGVLKRIGARVDAATVHAFILWLENEQGGAGLPDFLNNMGNPLGIQTTAAQAAGKAGNLRAAIANTAQLLLSNYGEVVAAFKQGKDVNTIANAIVNSPWNGSHYGGIDTFLGGHGAGGGVTTPTTTTTPAPANNPAYTPTDFTQAMNQAYTGTGAYKGFDLSAIPPALRNQAKRAIDAFTGQKGLEQTIIHEIFQEFPQDSWMATIPEVRTLLLVSAYNHWPVNLFQGQLENTTWWKSTSDNMRLWQQTQAVDPGQAQQAILEAQARVTNIANTLGVQLSQSQLTQIATTVAQQSVTGLGQFSNTNFTDQQIYQMVSANFNASTLFQSGGATGNPVTSQVGAQGDAAALYNAFQTIARNYYLNLTPQQIGQYVQQYISKDTGEGNFETGAIAGFTTTAQQMARQMYPGLASSLGTQTSVGSDNTPYQSTAWIRNMIAQFTGLGSGDNVDLTSPQWSWILSGGVPPNQKATNIISSTGQGGGGGKLHPWSGQGTPPTTSSGTGLTTTPATPTGALPSADALQSYLMQTPQFQTTTMGKDMAWQVGSQIVKAFGFN